MSFKRNFKPERGRPITEFRECEVCGARIPISDSWSRVLIVGGGAGRKLYFCSEKCFTILNSRFKPKSVHKSHANKSVLMGISVITLI